MNERDMRNANWTFLSLEKGRNKKQERLREHEANNSDIYFIYIE